MSTVPDWLPPALHIFSDPSWVQAIGSVIAIFVAVIVPAFQHRRDVLRHRSEQQNYRETILSVARQAVAEGMTYESILDDKAIFKHECVNTQSLQTRLDVLRTVTLETLPDPEGFTALLRIRQTLEGLVAVIDTELTHASTEGVNPLTQENVQDLLIKTKSHLSDLEKIIRR